MSQTYADLNAAVEALRQKLAADQQARAALDARYKADAAALDAALADDAAKLAAATRDRDAALGALGRPVVRDNKNGSYTVFEVVKAGDGTATTAERPALAESSAVGARP